MPLIMKPTMKPKTAMSSDPIKTSDYPHKHKFTGYPRSEARCKMCGEKRS